MGKVNCCNLENKPNDEIVSKKEEDEQVARSKAIFIQKHEQNEDKLIIIQRRIRFYLSKKKLFNIISNDKQKIKEYLEANDLYLTYEKFKLLINPQVNECYEKFKNFQGVFKHLNNYQDFQLIPVDLSESLLQNEESKKTKTKKKKKKGDLKDLNSSITPSSGTPNIISTRNNEVLSSQFNSNSITNTNYTISNNLNIGQGGNEVLKPNSLLKPIWLNKEKNIAYLGFWNLQLKPNGFGIFIKSDGSRYEGYFKNGLLNGKGRYFTIKSEYFEGDFVNGCACGKGIFIHPEGNLYYGDWKEDKNDGYGEEIFSDGSTFSGYFEKGKKNGYGKYSWIDGSSYDGYFKDDNINGNGCYIWADGSSYEGEWKNNLMNGIGKFIFPDKTFYEGDFINNKRSGNGIYYWNENKYHVGTFKDGKPHGKGKYTKNGTTISGVWHEGKRTNFQDV